MWTKWWTSNAQSERAKRFATTLGLTAGLRAITPLHIRACSNGHLVARFIAIKEIMSQSISTLQRHLLLNSMTTPSYWKFSALWNRIHTTYDLSEINSVHWNSPKPKRNIEALRTMQELDHFWTLKHSNTFPSCIPSISLRLHQFEGIPFAPGFADGLYLRDAN